MTELLARLYPTHIQYFCTVLFIVSVSSYHLALKQLLGIWTPLIVGLIAYMFLGLDALSAQIEEPFGLQENDLPLDSIVRLIERVSKLFRTAITPIIEAKTTIYFNKKKERIIALFYRLKCLFMDVR